MVQSNAKSRNLFILMILRIINNKIHTNEETIWIKKQDTFRCLNSTNIDANIFKKWTVDKLEKWKAQSLKSENLEVLNLQKFRLIFSFLEYEGEKRKIVYHQSIK